MERTQDAVGHLLEQFRSGPSLLKATLHQIPGQMWRWRPRPSCPTIHEMVLELAESEAGLYVTFRQWIAQPDSPLSVLANPVRPRSPVDFDQTVSESLKIISHLRRSTYRLLCNLPSRCWDYTTAPDGSITLKQWLVIQERHIPTSVQNIRDNHATWIRMHPSRRPDMKPAFS
jgi:hypothetical protein